MKTAYSWLKKSYDLDEFGKDKIRHTKTAVFLFDPILGEKRVDKRALSLMVAARQILDKQHPMTLRGLYYALFGAGWVFNSDEAYNAMKGIIVDARKLGFIPWDWIEDATREPHTVDMYDDLRSFMDVVKRAYRRDIWNDQDTYIEVVIEKRTGVAQAKEVCAPYGVTVCSGNGYGGWSAIYEMAKRIGSMQKSGKECVILYVGDFDPSGLHMFYDLQERLRFFAEEGTVLSVPYYERLAVNDEDIQVYDLPEAPGKSTDSRKDWMLKNYGKLVQVEMDALWSHTDENIFQEKVRAAIESFLDMDAYEATMNRQSRERRVLEKVVDNILGGDLSGDEEES